MFSQKKLSRVAVVAIMVSSLFSTGCNTTVQQQASALVGIVQTSAVALATLEGVSPDTVKKIQTDFAAAQVAVQNWKQGTPTQNIVALLKIAQDDLSLIPASPQVQALIQLALGTTIQVIDLFNPPVTSSPGDIQAHVKAAATTMTTKDQYKAHWNAIVAANPNLAPAAIK